MKIHALTFNDTARQWQLSRTEFNRLTLLVGASGVGKTQILDAIMKLQYITRGHSQKGIQWKIEFSINHHNRYLWEGAFENHGLDEDLLLPHLLRDISAPHILYERLFCNDLVIIERDEKNIVLEGQKTVKLPQQQSAIFLLKEEDAITPIYTAFQKIILNDYNKEINSFSSNEINIQPEHYLTLESIQASELSIKTKLYLIAQNCPSIFEQIKRRFKDVFIFVEDIKIEPILSHRLLEFMRGIPFIQIKEYGVKQWIHESYLSSGMSRTLMQIGELYLSANGTVALIDEFENSLGVNCINEVTGDLLTSPRDLQFIITSHHPYIINSIGYENWKLVTRKAGVVSTHNATDFNLGKSKHEAFTQLINLDAYAEGVEA
jgi:ABC-type dipeptide/oligopeptide/nickel transport system ATPase component